MVVTINPIGMRTIECETRAELKEFYDELTVAAEKTEAAIHDELLDVRNDLGTVLRRYPEGTELERHEELRHHYASLAIQALNIIMTSDHTPDEYAHAAELLDEINAKEEAAREEAAALAGFVVAQEDVALVGATQ